MIQLALSMYADAGPRESLEDAMQTLFLSTRHPHTLDLGLLGLFDGAGGAAAGEIASDQARLAFCANATLFAARRNGTELANGELASALQRVLRTANDEILQLQDEHPEWYGMATTAVCAAIHGNRLEVVACGDSRCYLERDGEMRRLTRDDTVIGDLIAIGQLSPSDALDHPHRHVITQYLGKHNGVRFQTHAADLRVGDVILLCSDGLTDVMSDAEIAHTINTRRQRGIPFAGLARELVETAIAFRTSDNVSVLAARCHLPHPAGIPIQTTTCGYPTEAARAAATLLTPHSGDES